MKKIYVGCSLMHATKEFRDSINKLQETLCLEGFEVLRFRGFKNGKPNGSPGEIYQWDIHCVKTCDFFLAECSYPSTGLGIEIGIATSLRKPTLAIATKDALVSSMIVGNTAENFEFYRYDTINEIIPLLNKKLL